MDLYLVIDSTGTLQEIGQEGMKRWAVDLVDEFDIGTSQSADLTGLIRVEVIEFWGASAVPSNPDSHVMVDIELGNYTNKNNLEQKIRNLDYKKGLSTIIPHGLAKLNEEIENHYDSGRKIFALVLTDGVDDSTSKSLHDLKVGTLEEEAKNISAKPNVEVFAIAFQGSGGINMKNLETIASRKDHIITDKNVSAVIERINSELQRCDCRSKSGEFDWCMCRGMMISQVYLLLYDLEWNMDWYYYTIVSSRQVKHSTGPK